MEQTELQRRLEAILFAAGEPVEISRLSTALEIDKKDIIEAADALANELAFERRGIRVIRLDKAYQMVSSGEMAEDITKVLETRKPPDFLPPSWRRLPSLPTTSPQPRLWWSRSVVLIPPIPSARCSISGSLRSPAD